MKTFLRALPLFFLAIPVLAQDEPASESALKAETDRIPVVREAMKRTAMILFRYGGNWAPIGSGGVVSPDGHVVTCAHVIEGGRLFTSDTKFAVVLADGKIREAQVLGRNSSNDIGLLKVEGDKLPHFDLTDTRPALGDSVIALGYPAGNVGNSMDFKDGTTPNPSIALGRVIDPNRRFVIPSEMGWKYYPDCIESDTPIFMGNSGGPLVDLRGRLVGLNAAISHGGKSYTLSVESIKLAYDDLKAGRDVEGRKAEDGMKLRDVGKLLGDVFGISDAGGVEREYLRADFARMSAARKSGVIPLYRGRDRVAYATVLDKDGHLAASAAAVDRRSLWAKALEKVGEGLGDDLKKVWNDAMNFLTREGPLEARLPSGRRVKVEIAKKSEKLGLVLLKVDERLEPIPDADAAGLEPGRWVAVLGGGERPITVGLLSAPKHTVAAGARVPLGFKDFLETWANGDHKSREFVDIILFDAALSTHDLGTPLCDGRGRMIGITIFHPARGTSYAVPVAEAKKELGLGK